MKDGREKGQRYMRLCAKAIQGWLGGEWRPRPTIVEPMEGYTLKGDLASRGVRWQPFSIECKHVEEWVLDGIFDAPKWPVWGWWEQCKRQAEAVPIAPAREESAIPLLLFSRNRRRNYVLADARTIEWLRVKPVNGPVLTVHRREEPLALCLLDDLVRARKPPRSSPGSA